MEKVINMDIFLQNQVSEVYSTNARVSASTE
jgi:hypothetical protein